MNLNQLIAELSKHQKIYGEQQVVIPLYDSITGPIPTSEIIGVCHGTEWNHDKFFLHIDTNVKPTYRKNNL